METPTPSKNYFIVRKRAGSGIDTIKYHILIMFTLWPEHRGDADDVIYDADGACEGRYGCVGEPMRANMGSREWVVMGLKSRAASAWVIKHLLLFSVKHVINMNSES